MRIRLFVPLLLFVFVQSLPCFAQDASRLIGTWERLYIRLANGNDLQPPQAVPYLTFTADGFHSYIGVPTGRKVVDKPLEEMTKEELLGNYKQVGAFWGPYSVSGNRITRRAAIHTSPQLEGNEYVHEFRFDG